VTHHEHENATAQHAHPNLLGPQDDELAECPVMPGSMVVKAEAEAAGLARDYNGQRYYLCCAGCAPLFDADPAKYAAAV
jgi:YHS domain-containing protein